MVYARAVCLCGILAVCALVLPGCKDNYSPVYYPNKDDLTVYVKGPTYDSLEEARAWVQNAARVFDKPNWTYEIGKNYIRSMDDVDIYEDTLQ